MSDVPTRLDVRTPETVTPATSANERDGSEQSKWWRSGSSASQERYHQGDRGHEDGEPICDENVPEALAKYYAQRYRLFHLYDEGIELDKVGLFSATPEKIAEHIAGRFSHLEVVVDLYSCVGGNSIQFAKAGMRVIGVEIHAGRIRMAKSNAKVYGVQDNVEFIKGDVLEVLQSLRQQFTDSWGIFMSPPWGGPDYATLEIYDVSPFKDIVEEARKISNNVAIMLPRNTDFNNIAANFGPCEVERNYLGGKMKMVTVYFGDLQRMD